MRLLTCKIRMPPIAADLWQIYWANRTNILPAVNFQGRDFGAAN
jgi:hypothetical protein